MWGHKMFQNAKFVGKLMAKFINLQDFYFQSADN